MFVKLPYDKNTIEVDIPEENLEGFLEPIKVAPKDKPENIIKAALEKPIGSKPLMEIIKPGEKVAIVTSDITRPCPSKIMLPPILEALEKTGVSRENITIVFALGSHRPHTEEEKRYRSCINNTIFRRVDLSTFCDMLYTVGKPTLRVITPILAVHDQNRSAIQAVKTVLSLLQVKK